MSRKLGPTMKGFKYGDPHRVPPCPGCGKTDRLAAWWEGRKRIVVCHRCNRAGEIVKSKQEQAS